MGYQRIWFENSRCRRRDENLFWQSFVSIKTKPIHTLEYRQMIASLRAAREEAGLTQAEVAAYFERPQSFISKCESGERRIDPTELRTFARLYRKPVSYFLEERAAATMELAKGP